MTRINAFIPVEELSNKHLIAKHREIKRIPNHVRKHFQKLDLGRIPKSFTLGQGHVTFFFDKGDYTLNRYTQLFEECKRRNFNVQNYSSAWEVYKSIFKEWNKNLVLPETEIIRIQTLIRNRIEENNLKSETK